MQSVQTSTLQRSKIALVLVLFCTLLLGYQRPASADGAASTRNIALGAAAIAAAILIHQNAVRHANSGTPVAVGTTADGGTIYSDGHIVYPNGDVLQTGNNGQACGWQSGERRCGSNPGAYYPNGYKGHRHDRGDSDEHRNDDHHKKHHHHSHEDHGD